MRLAEIDRKLPDLIDLLTVMIEAGLSFLGAGVPPEVPSWGNIIAQGRTFFQIAPWTILIPGVFLVALEALVRLVLVRRFP